MQAINFALTLPVDESGPRLTLLIIAHHVNYRSGDMFVGQDELAKEVRRDERTIRRYLGYLEERGFITREQNRTTDGKRTTDRIQLSGYIEWQNVIEKGGVIQPPETRGKPAQKPADNLTGRRAATGQNTPGQPDKTAQATGHMVSGTEGTTSNQDNHNACAQACDADAPPAQRDRPRGRMVVSTDSDWKLWLQRVAERMGPRARSLFADEGAMIVFDDGEFGEFDPTLPPPKGSQAYNARMAERFSLTPRSRAMQGEQQ